MFERLKQWGGLRRMNQRGMSLAFAIVGVIALIAVVAALVILGAVFAFAIVLILAAFVFIFGLRGPAGLLLGILSFVAALIVVVLGMLGGGLAL